MSLVAPTMQKFFTDRLLKQRQASPDTVRSYRNAFRLLLRFVHERTGKQPASLDWSDLGVDTIAAFLDHLENGRGNSARSRNARLAALRSLFHFAALRHPEHAELIRQVLAIPQKRFDKGNIAFLEPDEVDALLAAPDRTRWEGRRDHALLTVALQTGLRLSELTGVRCEDIELGGGAHIRCIGKGRKQRCVPLTTATVAIVGPGCGNVQDWRTSPPSPLAQADGSAMTRSRPASPSTRSRPASAVRPWRRNV